MLIIKKYEVAPERHIIIILYGVAGTGKTSLANTSKNPILIDFEKGYDRASNRVDTIVATKWTDITDELESIKNYDTVIVDTCKSAIDDYLAAYVVERDYKLQKNALKRFGAMGDEFKLFVNQLRNSNSDIVLVCHDKETVEGDIIRHSPDCTGQSKDLIVRIADQVGYMYMDNGKRVVNFAPTDTTIGKDTAQLGRVDVPNVADAKYDTFMADIISSTKKAIQSKSEAQKEAYAKLEDARNKLESVKTAKDANDMIAVANGLAQIHQRGFKTMMMAALKEKGFDFKDGKFVKE